MRFNEDFLHYIWKFGLFNHDQLKLINGDDLLIIHPGIHNLHSGPDFSNARLKIAETEWIGNIEIHIKGSDWSLHGHHHDPAYNNVILHVVFEDDVPAFLQDGTVVPVMLLKDRIFPGYLDKYEQLLFTSNAIPCQAQLVKTDPLIITGQLARALLERLIEKAALVYEKWESLKGDWEAVFYHFMARSFGFKVNAIPFEQLAQSLPRNLIARHKGNELQIEALVFGQAGFLDQSFKEAYPAKLRSEYQFLKKKYGLIPINRSGWKFMRMRPQNFPTIRLAQFAALMSEKDHLFSHVLSFNNVSDLIGLFESLSINEYWRTHYHFNKETAHIHTLMGRGAIENLLINTVALFLFTYGRHTDQPALVNRAIALLEYLPPENNKVVKLYALAGLELTNAFQTQAILQLNKNYCNAKKCLNCAIGIKILKR